MFSWLQIEEKDELLQAKERELVVVQQQLREQVIFITWSTTGQWILNYWLYPCAQEQSSRREIGDLEKQLQLSEALVADFQKTLQQRDSDLETLRLKVNLKFLL